jgi:hypothetical protein
LWKAPDSLYCLKIKNEYAQAIPNLPSFPPKKLFALSNEAKEERRQQIEKYLQQSLLALLCGLNMLLCLISSMYILPLIS